MPRAIRLSEDDTTKLLEYVWYKWYLTNSDWAPWKANLPKWTKQYRGFLNPKDTPWPGCSNLSFPMTPVATERLHSTYLGSIDDPAGLIDVMPTEAGDVGLCESMKGLANHLFFSDMKLHERLDPLAHSTCMFGQQGGVLLWRKTLRKQRPCFPVMKSDLGTKKNAAAIAKYHFGDQLVSARGSGTMAANCTYLDDGRTREAKITILTEAEREDPADDTIEFEVETQTVTCNHPELDIPAPEDLLCTPDDPDPRKCEVVFYSLWYTFSEIEDMYRSKQYPGLTKDLMEKLAKHSEQRATADPYQAGQPSRSYDETSSSVRTLSAMRRDKFHVQKVFMPWDADGDGSKEECVFTILWDVGHERYLLRGDYLESLVPHGRRPIIWSRFIYLHGVPTAIGAPEFLNSLASSVNTMLNQSVDSATLRNNPFFLYNSGSSMSPRTIRVHPGSGIPVDSSAGVSFPNFSGNNAEMMQLIEMLGAQSEKMVPHSDVDMGRGGGGVRGSQGINTLVQQSQQVWDKYIQRWQQTIEEISSQAIQLYAAFGPPWLEYRVKGTNELRRVSREDLRQGWDFEIRASMLKANKEIRRSYAMMRYQTFSANPFFQSEARMYNLIRDVYESQDVPNYQEYIGPPPDDSAHPHISPEQENSLFAQGLPWEPHPDENFQEHLASHHTFLADPATARMPKARMLVKQHILHTERLMSTVQRSQQQQAMGVAPSASPGLQSQAGNVPGAQAVATTAGPQPGAGAVPPGWPNPALISLIGADGG